MNVEWIKLYVGLLDNEKVKFIEKTKGGPEAMWMFIKVLCLAGKLNNGGFLTISESVPYTIDMLSTSFRMDSKAVKSALDILIRYGMLVKSGEIYAVKNWEKYQDQEALARVREEGRKRVQAYRERKKGTSEQDAEPEKTAGCNADVTRYSNVTCNADVTRYSNADVTGENKKRIRTEEEGEKELTPQTPLDGGPECVCAPPSGDLDSEFRTLWEMYPANRREGKKQALQSYREARREIGYETIKASLTRYLESVRGMEARYIKLASTWFRDCIEDEVFEDEEDDEIYQGPEPSPEEQEKRRTMTEEERKKADEALISRFFKKTADGWHMIDTPAANVAQK